MSPLLLSIVLFAQSDLQKSPSEGWTSERVVAHALARSPKLAAARARREGAGAELDAAWAAVLPRVRGSGRFTKLSDIDNRPLVQLGLDVDQARAGVAQIQDPATQAVLGAQLDELAALSSVTIEVPTEQWLLEVELAYPISRVFTQILPAIDARASAESAAVAKAAMTESAVLLDAVGAFHAFIRAESALEVSRLGLKDAEQALAAGQGRLRVDMADRTELLRLEARVAEAVGQLARAEAGLEAARVQLRTRAGIDAEDPLEVAEDLYRSSEPPPAAATESLVAQAWSHRPELAALRHAAAAQGSLAAAEWGGALPTLDGAAKLVYGQPNPYYVPPNDDFEATWLVAAVVEWSPDGAWAAGRRAEAAEAEQRALLADLEDVRDGVRIEVSDLAARLRASHRVLEAAEAGLKAAEAGHAAIQRAFELGASDATEVIDTQLQLQRARLGRVDAAVERRWLEVRLAEAIGARRAALAK